MDAKASSLQCNSQNLAFVAFLPIPRLTKPSDFLPSRYETLGLPMSWSLNSLTPVSA